jgi:hypothetical protein
VRKRRTVDSTLLQLVEMATWCSSPLVVIWPDVTIAAKHSGVPRMWTEPLLATKRPAPFSLIGTLGERVPTLPGPGRLALYL